MHEFLLNLKRWQMSSAVQDPIGTIAGKELKCLELCQSNAADAKDEQSLSSCKATCQKPRSDVERYMYKKESQFLQQLYKDCYQGREGQQEQERSTIKCYEKYNENLQLIKDDLTQYLNEKANEA